MLKFIILSINIDCFVAGADRFLDNIEMMIGRKTTAWRMVFKIFWKYLSPATLVVSICVELFYLVESSYVWIFYLG